MARHGDKHAVPFSIVLSDLRGGLNYVQAQQDMPQRDLYQAVNWHYGKSIGNIEVVPGCSVVYDFGFPVDTLFYQRNRDYFLLSSGLNIYRSDLVLPPVKIGEALGSKRPFYQLFGNEVGIASGDKLQIDTGGAALETVGDSPTCDILQERAGRMILGSSDAYKLRYSGTSSMRVMTVSSSDISMAQEIKVGDMDGRKLAAIVPFSKDLIVLKDSKAAYRIVDEPLDWSVEELSKNIDAANRFCVLPMAETALTLGSGGLINIDTVDKYGEYEPSKAVGAKINPVLAEFIDKDVNGVARLWDVPTLEQVWIKSTDTENIHIYHKLLGAFTSRTFNGKLADVCTVGQTVYLAKGNKVLKLDPTTDKDDGAQIRAYLKTKLFRYRADVQLKGLLLDIYNRISGTANIRVAGWSHPFSFSAAAQKIFGNTAKIYGNSTKIAIHPSTNVKERTNSRLTEFDVEIIVESGAFNLKSIELQLAEVGK